MNSKSQVHYSGGKGFKVYVYMCVFVCLCACVHKYLHKDI